MRNDLPKSRIEALTDGIFAVTMTLLVLDLRPPDGVGPGKEAFWEKLSTLMPRLDDYLISFVVLSLLWVGHQRLGYRVRHVDPGFVWLNLAFILVTTFLPLTTSLIGEHPGVPGAALLYGVNLTLIVVAHALMWRRGLLRLLEGDPAEGRALWGVVRVGFLLVLAVVLAAMIAAMLGFEWSSWLYVLLLVALLVLRPWVKGRTRPRHAR
jgi:uncharacterized membrane protein